MQVLAILMGKTIQNIIRKFNRGGGSLPGVFALYSSPKFLRKVTYPATVILVSGTNGKSTITNLLSAVLENHQWVVVSNLEGNNMKAGIVSLLLANMTWFGRCKADVLVLEVDELSVPRILEDLTPSHIMIGNLFRDQLDRVGEMESVIRKFEACLATYPNQLLLNGDDPNVARLALGAKKATITYFGVNKTSESKTTSQEASEGRFCPNCKNELVYEYYQYSHIGRYRCLFDEFGSQQIEYLAHITSMESFEYVVKDVVYTSPYQNVFAVYNETEVIAMSHLLQLDQLVVRDTISKFRMNNGRMEEFTLANGCKVVLNLAKNPTGVNESLKHIVRQQVDCVCCIVLNDLEADGQDISWIYDARFELLNKSHIKKCYTSGMRHLDMALRLQYADLSCEVVPISSLEELVVRMQESSLPVFVVANYTALQPMRRALKKGTE